MTAQSRALLQKIPRTTNLRVIGESDSYSPLQIAAQPIPVDLSYTSHASVEAVGEG
jgi:hypothetical protein